MSSTTVDATIPNRPPSADELPVPVGGEPETAILGPINGRYDIGPKIARGGMGVVYRAHDRLLNRTVAVKVMRGKYLCRPDLMRRFLAEARISGRLQHPGIVPVYEVGTLPDGRPFIAMKLIEGETLARLLRDRATPADHLAHYLKAFEVLCQAVAYAHQEGVIHRDLKPDNVMVGSFGEVQVMDWGLAKVLGMAEAEMPTPQAPWPTPLGSTHCLSVDSAPGGEHQTQATAIVAVGPEGPEAAKTDTGMVFGTAPFMPPEQARGELERVDRRGDVFALGAILCQVLTGQPPYYGPADVVRENAREGRLFGAYVLLDRCGVDPAIVLLAKHCLAVDPDDRPADAGVLAGLVNRCLEGLADRAKAMELGRMAAESQLFDLTAQDRLTRKARGLARGLAATAAVVAGLLTSGLWWYADDRAAREAAEVRRFTVAVTGIETALDEADAKVGDARRAPGGPFARDTAARLAAVAWQKADTLAETTADVPDPLRERLTETKARVDEAERGTRLAVALERWRTDLIGPKGVFDPAAAARKCADTLAAHGFDVRTMTPAVAAAALADHPAGPSIREVLADWLAVTQASDERKHLAAVLAASGDAPPTAWLAALDANDPTALADLSPEAIPAAGVAVVARRLTLAGQTDAAERLLTRGVGKHPENFTLNAQLGTLLRARPEARSEAIRYLSVAVAARPTDPAVGYELGSALADTGRADEAIATLVRAVEADPTHAPAQVRLGDLFAAKGDDYAAKQQYLAAVLADPGYAPAQVRLGARDLAADDIEAAERAFRTAVHSSPRDAAARAGLGRVLLKRGDAPAAAAEFRSATEIDPKDLPSRFGLVEALKTTGDRAGAIKEARAATVVAPTASAGHHTLGTLLRERGDAMGAIAAFRAAGRCAAPTVDTFRQMGQLYEAARDPRSAAEAYARAVELEPTDPQLLTALGRTQNATDHPDALKTYRRLLEIAPASASTRHHVGRLTAATGDEAGLADLTAAAAALPDSGDVKADLGSALLQFGRFREAATTLRQASALLGKKHPRADETKDAARRATRLAALESRLPDILNGTITPSSPGAWAEVGDMARRTNRLAAAATCYVNASTDDEYKAPAAATLGLAGFGRGADVASPAQRAAWRAEALKLLEVLPAEAKADPAFDGLRELTEGLPATERAAWRAVWGK